VTRPLVMAFAAVTIGGLVWPMIRGRTHSSSGPVASRADIPITVGLLVMGAIVLLDARGWPFRTAVFPLATGLILVVLSAVKLVSHLVRTRSQVGRVRRRQAEAAPSGPGDIDEIPDVFATASRRDWLSALGWMAAFFVALWLLGALITVPLFALVYLLAVPRSSPLLAGVYALASWAFVYGLFGRLLRLPLP
jgi:hypothetical protein